MHTILAAAGVFLVAISPIIVIGGVVRLLSWVRSGRGRHRATPTRPQRRPGADPAPAPDDGLDPPPAT